VTSFYGGFSSEPRVITYASTTTTVGTTAVLLATVENAHGVLVQNNSGSSQVIYLGGPSVTSSTGFKLAAGSSQLVPSMGGTQCQVYAIASATGATVNCLSISGQ
jgi:hypothetical protein